MTAMPLLRHFSVLELISEGSCSCLLFLRLTYTLIVVVFFIFLSLRFLSIVDPPASLTNFFYPLTMLSHIAPIPVVEALSAQMVTILRDLRMKNFGSY
jgi:hypothetical protein